jgi:choline transport protein
VNRRPVRRSQSASIPALRLIVPCQALLVLNYPDYLFARWHGTLPLYAVVLIAAFFNTALFRLLRFAEGTVLVVHILAWFAILISILVVGPHTPDAGVWDTFLALSGYDSKGLTFFVGLQGPVYCFLGADGATHMSEEVHRPRTTVPWALMSSITINGVFGFGMTLAFLYRQGDLEQNLASPTGFPFISAFEQALNSRAWATGWTAILLVLLIFCNVAILAAASRTTFAFAQDGGLPRIFGQLHGHSGLPLWSIGLTVLITILVGLVNIGSTTAFDAVVSAVIAAFYSSCFNAILLLLVRKFSGTAPKPGPWQMGRFVGICVNVAVLIFIVVVFIFCFFSLSIPVTLTNMNWSVVLYVGVIAIGLLWYLLWARKGLTPPTLIYWS